MPRFVNPIDLEQSVPVSHLQKSRHGIAFSPDGQSCIAPPSTNISLILRDTYPQPRRQWPITLSISSDAFLTKITLSILQFLPWSITSFGETFELVRPMDITEAKRQVLPMYPSYLLQGQTEDHQLCRHRLSNLTLLSLAWSFHAFYYLTSSSVHSRASQVFLEMRSVPLDDLLKPQILSSLSKEGHFLLHQFQASFILR